MARVSGVLLPLIIYSRPGGTLRARLIDVLAGGLSQAEAETFMNVPTAQMCAGAGK